MCAHLTALQVDNVRICDVEAVDGILGHSLREVDSTSSASWGSVKVPDPLSAQQVQYSLVISGRRPYHLRPAESGRVGVRG